ncbi:SGNH hydrolase-type esterase domain-containing protein [Xylaria digitata]|nr:SGNH hydrolase-type esterase domain-containing protein [Xylaria digitata]
MLHARFLLPFLVELGLGYADSFDRYLARDLDPAIGNFIDTATIPKYVAPPKNQDITEWFAIGDSFSAGVGVDVPNDSLTEACNRFRLSYPYQMNQDVRLPGHSDSRTFVFASCAGAKMQDVSDKQIAVLLPDLKANYAKMEKPQFGTVSLSWNDLGFADDCVAVIKAAHAALDDPNKVFGRQIIDSLEKILIRGRTINSGFQLYVIGYVRLWNDDNKQCDAVSWSPPYKIPTYITISLRQDMNSLVLKLNDVIQEAVDYLETAVGGVYFVDEFEKSFDGHRFCETESDSAYHKMPTDKRTWFIHHGAPYGDSSALGGSGSGTFFDMVDSIFIPLKDGKSTADQIKAANGNLSILNSAYDSIYSMTESLNQLAQQDAKYGNLPVIWARIMHPTSSGYREMSNAIIDQVLKYNTGPTDPGYPRGLECKGKEVNNFLSRDELSLRITEFCGSVGRQKTHDQNSGSISRTYNTGLRYEVRLGMDWPEGLDISENIEAHCINNMTTIMDSCDGDDVNNPLNWKRGGRLGAGWVNYVIFPAVDQGYTPGTCSFHLQEDESWRGVDGAGTQRVYTYYIERATMRDGAGNTIGTLGFAPNGRDPALINAGDGHGLDFYSKLPDTLVITPEARGNPRDYIQFAIGSQSWRTTTTAGSARCETGSWTSDYSPRDRNMDCYFIC